MFTVRKAKIMEFVVMPNVDLNNNWQEILIL